MLVFLLFYFGFHVASAELSVPCIELNDGNKVPVVALGTGKSTAKEGDTNDLIRDSVYWAIEAGYRHIDTAAIYEDEEEVGQGIAAAISQGLVTRDQLFVTTKLWNDRHARDQVIPALQESLYRLGLDYIDLYLIHYPISMKEDGGPDNIDYLETWQGMEDAREAGLARSIGVSNFNATQVDRLVAYGRVRPVINEIEVNPTNTQEDLVYHCQQLGIAVMAYSPFGYVVSRKDPDAPPPKYNDPLLVSLSQKYGKSPGQIVLRYLIDRGCIPIPKSTNKNRIAENIDLFDFELNAEEVAAISRFNKNKRVIDISHWKDYPNYPNVAY